MKKKEIKPSPLFAEGMKFAMVQQNKRLIYKLKRMNQSLSTDNLEKIRLENYKTTETAVGHVLGYNRALNEIIDFLPNHTK